MFSLFYWCPRTQQAHTCLVPSLPRCPCLIRRTVLPPAPPAPQCFMRSHVPSGPRAASDLRQVPGWGSCSPSRTLWEYRGHEGAALPEGVCKSEAGPGKPQQVSYLLLCITFPVHIQAMIAVGTEDRGLSCLRTFLQHGCQALGASSHTAGLISLVFPLTSTFC